MNPGMYVMHILIMAFIWAIVASSWDLLGGYAGQASFGHGGFYAIGAYTSAMLSLYLGISPWVGLFLGAIFTATLGFLVGLPCLKLKGPYLAIVTLGFSEITRLVLMNWTEVTGGALGLWGWDTFPGVPMGVTYVTRTSHYYIALIVLLASCFIMYGLGQSSIGLIFKAIREDETLAESLGINITFHKLLVFVVSTFFAGLAGSFFAYYILFLNPAIANPWTSIFIIVMAVAGGTGTIVGPVIGAISIQILYEYLRVFGVVYNLVAVALLLILVMLLFPRGFIGLLELLKRR